MFSGNASVESLPTVPLALCSDSGFADPALIFRSRPIIAVPAFSPARFTIIILSGSAPRVPALLLAALA